MGPFRAASVPRGVIAFWPAGMDAGRPGPTDAERSEAHERAMNATPEQLQWERGFRHDAPWTWTDEGVATGAWCRRRRMVGAWVDAR